MQVMHFVQSELLQEREAVEPYILFYIFTTECVLIYLSTTQAPKMRCLLFKMYDCTQY